MRGHDRESGFALILLIGITAALAIFAAVMVMMLDNQQHSTSKERTSKTTLYYAEAALNSAVNAVEANPSWTTAAYTGQDSTMNQQYSTLSGTGSTHVTYRVYDNVNLADNWDSNHDGLVWVEVTTTYPYPGPNPRTTTVRELVSSSTSISILPKAAAYADTDIDLQGTSNIYAVNNDGTPDTSGAPYVTSVMCGGDITLNGSTTLASPADSTHTQSIGLQLDGTLTQTGHSYVPVQGGVGLLSDYFDQSHQAALMTEAQVGMTNPASSTSGYVSVDPSKFTPSNLTTTYLTSIGATFSSGTKTYTFSSALLVTGNLTLSTSVFPAGTTFNFQNLHVNGKFTLTGNVTVSSVALYTTSDFTVSGTTTSLADSFGPTYCAGTIDWNGGSSGTRLGITTGALFAKILSVDSGSGNSSYDGSSGPTDITLGPTWIDGDAGTGDVAVDFAGPSNVASTVMCPVLATTEQTHSNGLINCGTLLHPMIYFMQCDNDNLYSNHLEWASNGTYYGLMILFEAEAYITGGNDGTHPNIMGAVLEGTPYVSGSDTGTDLTLSSNSSICYNQAVINNCTSDSLKTTTIAPVPGTWQQIAGT